MDKALHIMIALSVGGLLAGVVGVTAFMLGEVAQRVIIEYGDTGFLILVGGVMTWTCASFIVYHLIPRT
jgi:hypothetical protein